MAMVKKFMPESIIEYSQDTDSPIFSYNKKDGAIDIFADESVWIWKIKAVKINSKIYYNDDYYNLFFFPCIEKRNIISVYPTVISERGTIVLCNTGLLPRFIKKGDLLGKAYIVPITHSHVVKID